ncbi:MAG: hypothetical protein EPN99_06775 [Frankiales bacterium]|nr:MAG: hypothetical protein EPN99_06775 [Frankiales bacterium]
MARTVPPLSRLVPAALALLLAVGAGGLAVLSRDDQSAVAATGYRIAYDVVDVTSGRRTTELVEVDRSRGSRRLLPDGGGTATTESGVFDRVDGRWRQLAVVPPGEPGQDLQLAAPLAWAETAGLASRDGTGEFAGLPCTWWLTREPLDVGTFASATAEDRARSCVDDAGRLLADTWRAAGRDVRTRTATSVTSSISFDAFDGARPAPLDARLVTTAVEPLTRPMTDLVRFAPLQGSSVAAVVRFVDVTAGTVEVERRVQRAVLTRDGAVVVLDQVRPAAPVTPRGDREVDLGRLGTGLVRAIGGGLVVEVAVGPGLLRVRSGVPLDELTSWLSELSSV